MPAATKTDNANLDLKLALRRHFLDRYHAAGAAVFNACEGNDELWRRLRPGRHVTYTGVDLKPARGRLCLDSERVLRIPGWKFDVVDLDTYGSPWGHYFAALANAPQSFTCFLTFGLVKMGGGVGLPGEFKQVLNPPRETPSSLGGAVQSDFCLVMVAEAERRGWQILECKEAVPFEKGTARYWGLRLAKG